MDIQELLKKLEEIEKDFSEKRTKKLNLAVAKRIVKRLDTFSTECNDCKDMFDDFSVLIEKMMHGKDSTLDIKFSSLMNDTSVHLHKIHKLVPENHYKNTYMSYGVALGLVFGGAFSQLVHQNALIGIGLPIGISIGLAMGSKLDEDTKKEGMQI